LPLCHKGNSIALPHPSVQNFDRCCLVDHRLLLLGVAASFAEFVSGGEGGQRFIDEHERDGRDALVKSAGKGADFRGGASLAAVHADGQANDEGFDFPQINELGDALDGVALGLMDGLNRMREDAEVIGRSDADAGLAMVDAEGGMRGS